MNSLLLSKSSYYTMDCDVSSDRGSDHTILLATHEIVSSDDYQSSPDSIHHHPHHEHHSQIHNYSLHPQSISNDDEEDDDVIFDIDQPPPLLQVEEDRDPLALDDAAEEELLRLQSPPKLDLHPPLSVLKAQHAPRINARAMALSSKEKMSSSASDMSNPKPMPSSAAKSRKPASTMREVLASLPGFSVKPRRRSNKKMSTAAQIEQTKNGKIDLETPDSILVSTNLRALLNKQTFSLLPPLFQHSLVQLLPSVDRPSTIEDDTGQIRLNASALNNEFFARACLDWRERLSSGELTPENQNKLKTEAEREMSKLDPWKLKHFEPIWGDKSYRSKKISSDSTSDDRATISMTQPTTISSTHTQSHHTMALTLASTPEPESGSAPPPTPETPLSQGSSGSSVVAECSDVPSSSTHSLSPCRPIMTTSSLSTSSGETNAAEITISSSNSSTSSVEIIDDYPQDDENRNKDDAHTMRHSPVEMPSEPEEGNSAIENLSRRGDCAKAVAPSSLKFADSELDEEEFSSDLADGEEPTIEKDQSQPNSLKYLPDNGTVLYEIEVDMVDANETSHIDEHSLDQHVGKRTSSPEERDAKQIKLCDDIEWDVVDGNENSNQMLDAADEIIPDGELPMTAAEMEIFSSSFVGNSDSSVLSDCSNESMPEALVDDAKMATPPDSEDNMMSIPDDNIIMDEVSLPPSPLLESVVYADDQSSLSPSAAHKLEEENEVVVSTTVDESTRSSASQPENHLDESNSLGDSYIEIDPDEQYEEREPFESLSQTIQISKIIQSSSARFSQISDPVYTIQRPPTSNSPAIYRLALSPSTQLKVVSRVKPENTAELSRPRTTILKLPMSSPAATSQSSPLALCQPANSLQSSHARGRKPTSNLPPGAVNLERSYQICQAVIQNSPNRHQFQAQLKPPPYLGSSNGSTSSGVASSVISSTVAPKADNQNLTSNNPPVVYKVITAPRLGFPRKKIVHRQFASPTIVRRHIYATDTNLTNINNAHTTTTTLPLRIQQQQQPLPAHQTTVSLPHQQQFGQYVLIQRGNVASTSDSQVPRASSAPPAQSQQQQIHGLNGLLNNNNNNKSSGGGGGVRIRPASVGMNSEVDDSVQDVYVIASGSESRTAIATKPISNGLAYAVDMTNHAQHHPQQQIRQQHQHVNTQVFNKRVPSGNSPSNCSCSLNAMVVCQKCGAYCQDDCMSSSKLCLSCTIR